MIASEYNPFSEVIGTITFWGVLQLSVLHTGIIQCLCCILGVCEYVLGTMFILTTSL